MAKASSPIYQGLGGYFFTLKGTQFGPYVTEERAERHRNFKIAHGLQARYPSPTQVWESRARTPSECTVLAIANEGRSREPLVVYQGDDGEVLARDVSHFMEYFRAKAGEHIEPVTQPEGQVSAAFTDAQGELCMIADTALTSGRLYLGRTRAAKPNGMTEEANPVMALDKQRVRELIPYLQYFAEYGMLPDSPLGVLDLQVGHPVAGAALAYLRSLVYMDKIEDFRTGVQLEVARQDSIQYNDDEKEDAHYLFLVGTLLGKAMKSRNDGDNAKARHHLVSAAAVIFQNFRRLGADESLDGSSIKPSVQDPATKTE